MTLTPFSRPLFPSLFPSDPFFPLTPFSLTPFSPGGDREKKGSGEKKRGEKGVRVILSAPVGMAAGRGSWGWAGGRGANGLKRQRKPPTSANPAVAATTMRPAGIDTNGPIETLGCQAFHESAHQINRLVVRCQRMGTIRWHRTTRTARISSATGTRSIGCFQQLNEAASNAGRRTKPRQPRRSATQAGFSAAARGRADRPWSRRATRRFRS